MTLMNICNPRETTVVDAGARGSYDEHYDEFHEWSGEGGVNEYNGAVEYNGFRAEYNGCEKGSSRDQVSCVNDEEDHNDEDDEEDEDGADLPHV